jgi:hypothetical protein
MLLWTLRTNIEVLLGLAMEQFPFNLKQLNWCIISKYFSPLYCVSLMFDVAIFVFVLFGAILECMELDV